MKIDPNKFNTRTHINKFIWISNWKI